MHQLKIAGWAIVALLLGIPANGQAQVYTEIGDAGGTAATAQTVFNSGGVTTTINGRFSTVAPFSTFNAQDMDVYRFVIATPATFSATTVNAGTAIGSDTMLFLFNPNGTGIAMNDDTSGTDFRSTLPAGHALYASLTPGVYLLAVSTYDVRPTTSAVAPPGNVIFPQMNTGINGPAAGLGSAIFDGQTSLSTEPGPLNYSITLTGVVPVPEPGTLAFCTLAGVAGLAIRRRQRARTLREAILRHGGDAKIVRDAFKKRRTGTRRG